MNIETFDVEHIRWMKNYGGQDHLIPLADLENLKGLSGCGNHYSFFHEGELVACAGVIRFNDYRAEAWALLQSGRPEVFVALHRAMRETLAMQPFRRIEAHTDPTVQATGRWMGLLGFVLETPYKPFFFPDGRGAAEWVRYKN